MSSGTGTVLPILCDGDGPVARQGERVISRATFLAEIEQLAEQLPDRPYVVNFCADRYRFTVAWAAAMLRCQVTLLPNARDAGAVAALIADYPALYVLSDDDGPGDVPGPWFAYPALRPEATGTRVPAFPPDRVAAVLFTSGSTGRPNPSPRRWGRLVAGSLAAGTALGAGHFPGSALFATVPHAHSYGLESAVMLPLLHGLLLTAERPFFPADIAAALDRDRLPGILVTTPVHLRALVGDAAGPGFGTSFRAGFVLSATAPLSGELAARAETVFNAPVFEIYGCSEAGQLATRRTVEGPVWRCLDGFRLYNGAAGCWASGPDEADVRVADEIEPVEGGGFILRGRTADLVNVAGKRSSLAYLTRQLIDIDGVEDGVFLLPEDDTPGVTPRLSAVAVAPGLDAATILSRLRGRIDAAFLPRPLHVVDALPRNDLGKLPRSEILRLVGLGTAGETSDSPEVGHQRMTDPPPLIDLAPMTEPPAVTEPAIMTDPGDRERQPTIAVPIRLHFPAGHPAGPGHFPGNPIIPGAVLLDELVLAVCPGGWPAGVESAKFHHRVRPGDTLTVTHTIEGSSIRFECRLAETGQLVLSGALRTTFPTR
jgi:acyl-coenzyme A synthetase/AMP-(fatty) acid ligase